MMWRTACLKYTPPSLWCIGVLAHGVGLCDEYPSVRYPENIEAHGYDDCFEVVMTL